MEFKFWEKGEVSYELLHGIASLDLLAHAVSTQFLGFVTFPTIRYQTMSIQILWLLFQSVAWSEFSSCPTPLQQGFLYLPNLVRSLSFSSRRLGGHPAEREKAGVWWLSLLGQGYCEAVFLSLATRGLDGTSIKNIDSLVINWNTRLFGFYHTTTNTI